ncbi:MAG TPA: aminotransferase class I/II-fold pyridoxal phosphate-dependent enzyme [Phycisphaerae bacterium]|nr:aminotransferase class I/II-fold pyridoxal phosphate-dependent enzyme [Phycisphaerae bacterium]HRY71074.1 aminotransferase class I/II-fold pyridoxal phosphate-dependent enzyme [Phycisphaerae bacterium]HSA29751.1 aminotransferase class I/II-fold pyridoxal phosphate-dependent enzyme [Phycisphaerae bacterium]
MANLTPERLLSQRSRSVDASGIRKVFDLGAKLKDPINFSIGQPDYDVPPAVRQAAIDAIQSRRNGYTVTQGIAPLCERLAADLKAECGVTSPILVTSGVSGGILLALMAVLNPGDEVVIGDPYFVIYKHAVKLVGGIPVMVDTYPTFGFDLQRYEAAITPRTKMIVLATPSNPTGVVLAEAALRQAADLATRHNLLLLVDEIYNRLVYDTPSPCAASFAPDRTLLLRGFGKSYGMTGWRLGYATGPKFLIDEMTKLQQYTFVCAPSMVQYAGLAALDADISGHVDDYRRKRDLAAKHLAPAFEFAPPGGGFYIFPKVPERFANATEFATNAIERNVLIIPGGVFSERDTHFRLSYATSNEKIVKGCEILCALASGE